MADNRHHLDESREAAGRDILRALDSVGFDAYAVGWIHDFPTGTWRYLLSTPMLKSKGPIWIYRRLRILFKHVPLPAGISPLDIFVIDPNLEMALFGGLFMIAEFKPINPVPGQEMPTIRFSQDMKFEEFSVTDGFVTFYRRLPENERRRHKNPQLAFDHKVRVLAAA